ncbi:tyrosinase family protein [Mycetohabitans sp. B5]|uniref:Tyrosinase n=1 Tax=Mycetohabitans endofungorum TaxID=417203 RepID=A0A2P5K749_9BURK|nr:MULTISPECIES: tyrosinase family protein [Mycetohabitans]MCG1055051.1 tyrosinase family protein [Mycetohabitans sp. B5]PPB81888.1 tyrosinase [Mycetohabitans endofungorum]
MNIRRNHRDMTPDQKSAFVQSVLKLKNEVDSVLRPGQMKRYDDFVQVHKNAMIGPDMFRPMPHGSRPDGSPLFCPWHRILLRQFELALQEASNDATITIPYWNWSISGDDNPFSRDFMGGNGDRDQDNRVTDGPFAFSTGQFPIRIWDESNGDPGLQRNFGEDSRAHLPPRTEVESSLRHTPYFSGPNSWEAVLQYSLHNPVHNWIGGNMARATSPNDPVFFLHHCYVDRLWEQWKQKHPTIDPYLPKSGAPDKDLDSQLVFNAPGKPAPWEGTWTVAETISTAELGYEYG